MAEGVVHHPHGPRPQQDHAASSYHPHNEMMVVTTAVPVAPPDYSHQPPAQGTDAEQPRMLEPNWHAAQDTAGQTYYYNSETSETRWDAPVVQKPF